MKSAGVPTTASFSLSFSFKHGLTCAHIAATKGSLAVVKELMDIDISSVLEGTMKVA